MLAPTACAALVLIGDTAVAQSVRIEPSVRVDLTASSNVRFATSATTKESDLILVVGPQIRLSGNGGGYRLQGTFGFDAVTYLGGTLENRVLPRGDLSFNGRVIERLLFVDSSVSARTVATDPFFGVQANAVSTANITTVTSQRFSPYIERELAPGKTLLARSDNRWVQTTDNNSTPGTSLNPLGNSFVQANELRYEMRPQPFGVRADLSQVDTRYRDAASTRVTFETARVSALYAPHPQVYFGLTAGRDKGKFALNEVSETLTGVILRWLPTERTNIEAEVERRFFGTGWNFTFTHRTPFMAITSTAVRTATTYAAQIANLPAGGNTYDLLDAIFMRTYPNDPAARANAVNEVIAQRGLGTTLASAVALYSGTAQQLQSADLSVAYLSPLHTVTWRVFRQETRQLLGANSLAPTSPTDANQIGGSLSVARRLSQQTTADITVVGSRVAGLGVRLGDRTVNKSVRLSATHAISPRTTVSAGIRRQVVDRYFGSTFSGATGSFDASESAVFVGALHRF
ncbi:MAG: TIGR03016 family PEP-CTERM system-associated outer membrane protein [Burkholderiales bacterium]